jgi:nitrite reductase (NADH) small subunit
MTQTTLVDYIAVCGRPRIAANRGVAALVDGVPVALFVLDDGSLHALDNVDPFSGASVMSRGLTGDSAGEPTVASPMYKQRFSLHTGQCLDDPRVAIQVHDVRVRDGIVEVRLVRST